MFSSFHSCRFLLLLVSLGLSAIPLALASSSHTFEIEPEGYTAIGCLDSLFPGPGYTLRHLNSSMTCLDRCSTSNHALSAYTTVLKGVLCTCGSSQAVLDGIYGGVERKVWDKCESEAAKGSAWGDNWKIVLNDHVFIQSQSQQSQNAEGQTQVGEEEDAWPVILAKKQALAKAAAKHSATEHVIPIVDQ